LVLFIFSLASSVMAQTRLSATSVCQPASSHQTITIDDERRHSISIDQRTCRWTAPLPFGPSSSAEYIASGIDDVQVESSHDSGYAVGKTTSGDKYFIRYLGTANMKGGAPSHLAGTWTFTGGTGALRGLTGHGTYSAEPTSAGGMSFRITPTLKNLSPRPNHCSPRALVGSGGARVNARSAHRLRVNPALSARRWFPI
jgi:hypothetical protein